MLKILLSLFFLILYYAPPPLLSNALYYMEAYLRTQESYLNLMTQFEDNVKINSNPNPPETQNERGRKRKHNLI